MSQLPVLLIIAAGVLGIADELQSEGRSLVGWAVVLLAIALVWGRL